MQIPSNIKIGKHKIVINFVTPTEEEQFDFVGRFSRMDFEIDVNTNYPKSVQEEGFIHELLHATDIIYGLGLSEHQITVLAERIYSNFLPLEIEKEDKC